MLTTFAVVPDGSATPTGFFPDLGDALNWGLRRYGSDRFVIRAYQLARPTSGGDGGGDGDRDRPC
jgi:hypothetical protein